MPLSLKNSLHSATASPEELVALIQAALSPTSTNDERVALNIEIVNLVSSNDNYSSVLAKIALLPDEVASVPVKLASLSQIRYMFIQLRCPPIHTTNEVFTTLFNVICSTSVSSLLSASIDTFSTVLARSSHPPYDTLLAVCASTNSICGTVIKLRNMAPALLFIVDMHISEPELSVRILRLIESIIEKLSTYHLVSEKGLGSNLDSFICYMLAVMDCVLSQYKELPAFASLMTHIMSIFILLIPGARTIPQSTIEPLVMKILTLVADILSAHQRTFQTNQSVGHILSNKKTAYTLLAVSWRCLSHIFSIYQMALDHALNTARDLACKSILTDLSLLIPHTELTNICGPVGFCFLNALPKDPGGPFEAYVAGPLAILQTILNYGSMQTNDAIASSFFHDQSVSMVISNLIVYGCCLDSYDLAEWMTSPFNGALLDISGGKVNECCDFTTECFFGFQGFLIKSFITTFTTAITTFSSLTEESTEYFTTALTLDSILAVFGAIWPSLTIDNDHPEIDGHGDRIIDKDYGALFLFEDAYSIFDSLFRVCSLVLKRPLYCSSATSQLSSLGNLLLLRRLTLFLTYVSAAILPEFVDSCFSLLLCFLQAPMLTDQSPSGDRPVETYIGLQVLAANAVATIITDMSSANAQKESLLSSNHVLNILFAEMDILAAVFSDSNRLPSDGYLDAHTMLVESLLSFVNSEQDNIRLEQSFFTSILGSLGSLVMRALKFSDRSSVLHRLLNCYREALVISIYAFNLEQQSDLSASLELFKLVYPVYMNTILPLINSVLIDTVLEVIRAILSLLDLCSSFEHSNECLEATALTLFQLASTTKQSASSRELMYTHTTVTSLIITMIQLYPTYMLTGGQAVTIGFLSYLFSFTEGHTDIPGFCQTFATFMESLADANELPRVLYKDTQLIDSLPRIHQFISRYAYVPPDTPLIQVDSLMVMDLPMSAILIYLSFRCAYTSINADSHRSILLRAYCYAAPLVYAIDTCVAVLGSADTFLTRLSDFLTNLLPCLNDALFNKRIATILQVFITLDSYDGPQSSDIHTILNHCMPHLAETVHQFRDLNTEETDPTYTAIMRALENLIDRRSVNEQ